MITTVMLGMGIITLVVIRDLEEEILAEKRYIDRQQARINAQYKMITEDIEDFLSS